MATPAFVLTMRSASSIRHAASVAAFLLTLALLTAGSMPAFAQGSPQAGGEKELIAVMELDAVGASKTEAAALTERLREVLLKTGRFTLVDRARTASILDEQALQQAACSSDDCAVKVGQLLGVRKMVAGKAIKLGNEQWLLSVLVVSVETAETLRLESLRYQGSLLGMLDTQLPALGRRLAGLEAAPTDGGNVSVSSARPTAQPDEKRPVKLALFPPLFEGSSRGPRRGAQRVPPMLVKMLKRRAGNAELRYSYVQSEALPEPYAAFQKQPAFEEIGTHTWSGFFFKDPDPAYIYQVGRELGVDVVVTFRTNTGRGIRQISVYLFDINRLRTYKQAGTFEPGDFFDGLAEGFGTLFRRSGVLRE